MALSKFAKNDNLNLEIDEEIEILLEDKDEVLKESDCKKKQTSNENLQCNCNETICTINADGLKSFGKLHGEECERMVNDDYEEEIFSTYKIPDLEQKVKDIILSNKRHPAKRLHPEYLWEKLEELVIKGILKRHDSEDGEHHIYNYTNKPFKNPELWDYFSLISRGLVLRVDHEWYEKRVLYPSYVEVAALTWPKFFNINEDLNPYDITKIPNKWEITNKVDGSLGIIFFNTYEQKWQCCTKGSFTSDQAKFANNYLAHTETERLTPGNTYLVEIVCDKNDLIIEYNFQGLILLGAYTSRGEEYTYDELKECCEDVNTEEKKMFDLVDALNFDTIQEVEKYLNITRERKNMIEGVVVKYYINEGCHRFKWKSQAYLNFHLTREKSLKKGIFQALSKSDEDAEEMREKIQEKLHPKFDQIVQDYRNKINLAIEIATTMLGLFLHEVENNNLENSKKSLVEWLDKVLFYNKDLECLCGALTYNGSKDSKVKLDEWLDKVLYYQKYIESGDKKEKKLILKAYADGMDTFEKNWIQTIKQTKINKDRKFLFNYISEKKK